MSKYLFRIWGAKSISSLENCLIGWDNSYFNISTFFFKNSLVEDEEPTKIGRAQCELPHDHQPPMSVLPQRDFHAGEAAMDYPVYLKEFVEGESLVELPKCLHAFHPTWIETWLTQNHASCPICRLHIELQFDNVV